MLNLVFISLFFLHSGLFACRNLFEVPLLKISPDRTYNGLTQDAVKELKKNSLCVEIVNCDD